MQVLSSAYGLREGVEPLEDLAVRLRAFGPQVRVCAWPECAAAVGCAARVATGVVSDGVWR